MERTASIQSYLLKSVGHCEPGGGREIIAAFDRQNAEHLLAIWSACDAETRCHRVESLVDSPQPAARDGGCSEQVNVHITDATTVEPSHADEVHYLVVFSDIYRAQLLQQFQRRMAVREVTARELTHDEGMHDYLAATETLAKFGQALAKVVYPNRRIGENHVAAAERLLGTGSSCG